jgi:TolB-like protein/Tfp pilus assembly protein PilF
MSGFLEEVKRRKVYRVAIAYAVASWAIAQGLAQVLPVFEIPNSNSVTRVAIALMLVGFPVALVLGWMFDITPAGIERTPDVATHVQPRLRRRRNVLLVATAGILISAAVGFFVLPLASARKVDKSIAVLPFQNLSDNQDNAYFADGIQDDLLTNLSKIGDLKVISRTSVMQYRDKPITVREIGKALGVSNVLEGSVRRSGNKVRVNVQLIDANTDEHVWASDYDRDVTDVFAIQTDLAQKIADALQAKLSPGEKSRMERKPTENGEAYVAFVEANNLACDYQEFDRLKQSEQLYERAIQLDPTFALALARYSQLESWIQHDRENTPARREKARALADRALQLQPDLPEAHLALGYCYYYGDQNYDVALQQFDIARQGLPNDAGVYMAIGAIQRRQGKWAESTANMEKAVSLNPKDAWSLQNLSYNYAMVRNYDAANKAIDRALALDPTGMEPIEVKSKFAIAEKGDFSVAERGFESLKSVQMTSEQKLKTAEARAGIFLLQRRYQEALREAENLPEDQFATYPWGLQYKYFFIGIARRALQDEPGARAAFLKAKSAAEEQLKRTPNDAKLHIQLAKTLAFLGEKDSALAEAQTASQLQPESKDALDGPHITEGVAEVYAILGDNDRAIEILEGLLNRPSYVTAEGLKVNPIWDSLRSDPRFQALIEKHGAKA